MSIEAQGVYRMHDAGDDSLYPAQEVRLELADLVDQMCRENNIKYTLIYSTLMGGIEAQGFLPNIFHFQIGMFYEDMLRFKEIFQQEYGDSAYYLLDHSNFKQFDKMDLLVMKRGAVHLPPEKQDEERYYDPGLVIVPIFNAGDTKKEYKEFVKTAAHLMSLVNARDFSYELLSTRKKIRHAKYWRKRKKLVSLKGSHDFEDLCLHLTKYENRSTRYVYISIIKDQEGCIREKETYQDVEEILFEDHRFLAIRKRQEWINSFYSKKEHKYFISQDKAFRVFEAYGRQLLRSVQDITTDLLGELDRICRKHEIKYYMMFGTLIGALRHKGFVPWDDDADVVMMYDDFCKFCEIAIRELDPEKYFLRIPETDPHCTVTFANLMRVGARRTSTARESDATKMWVNIDIFCLFPGNELRLIEIARDRMCRFFKTMMWAHFGADDYNFSIRKLYYKFLQKFSHLKAYEMFFKIGSHNKGGNTNKLLFPYIVGLFYRHGKGLTDKNNYGDPIDLEFEGMKLMAPQNYHEILTKTYGDYINRPLYDNRVPGHVKLSILDFTEMK